MVNKIYNVSEQIMEAKGSKHNQILMSIIVCMPVLSYGAAMGWLSPHAALLTSPGSPASPPLTSSDVSWLAAVMFVTAPPAVFAFGAAADRFGRKRALLAASLPIAAGWALKLASSRRACLVAARALIGAGSGGAFVVSPLYVNEISDADVRGMTGTFVIFSQTMGNLLVFVLGDALPYRAVLWVMLGVPLLHAALMLRLPDSPAHLARQGRYEETLRVVCWLRSLRPQHAAVRRDVERLRLQQAHAPPRFSPTLLFGDATALKAFWLTLVVNLTREFCGCIAVLVYASHIFAAAAGVRQHDGTALAGNSTGNWSSDEASEWASEGASDWSGESGGAWLSPNKQSIVLAVVQIVGSFVACQLVDRLGRKPLLLVTSLAAGCGMLALGGWFYWRGGNPAAGAIGGNAASGVGGNAAAGAIGGNAASGVGGNAASGVGGNAASGVGGNAAAWVPVLALCVCIFADAAGLQPLPFVIMTEMFSFQLRGTVATLVMAISLGTDFAILKAFAPLTSSAGYHATFWLFAAVCGASGLYLWRYLPETKRKDLASIYAALEGRPTAETNDKTPSDCKGTTADSVSHLT